MNRRGMSAVVTTLIIILLAIVAVGIIWVVVKNILDKGRDEITLTGITLDLEITKVVVDDNGTPDDDTDDKLLVTVKRNPGEGNLVGINFIIGDGDNSVVVTRDTTLAELGFQTFTFTLSALAVVEITSISVAPIFETSSGNEITGEIKDTTTSDSGDLGTGGGEDATGDPGGEDPPCTPECTGLDCGDDGCGDVCGTCDEGYSCAANQTCMNDSCEPTFSTCESQGYNCSTIYDSCGDIINCTLEFGGDCTYLYNESWVCSNHVCVYEPACTDTCETLGFECGLHEICGVDVNCEFETGGCPSGYECIPGNDTCQIITYINTGLVGWYGPPDVTQYFSSDSLPKTNGLYYGYAATFPDLLTPDCYLIIGYSYDEFVYENAIVELSLDSPVIISTGEAYQIWESYSDCTSSL